MNGVLRAVLGERTSSVVATRSAELISVEILCRSLAKQNRWVKIIRTIANS